MKAKQLVLITLVLFLTYDLISCSEMTESESLYEVKRLSRKSKAFQRKKLKYLKKIAKRKILHAFEKNDKKTMKINNNLYVLGNVTSTKILTENISVTGQVIVQKSISSKYVKTEKLASNLIFLENLISPNGVITFAGNVLIDNHIHSNTKIKAKSFIVKNVKQWEMSHFDNFDNPKSLKGWSNKKTSKCKNNKNTILGGHCNFSFETVSKIFSKLPKHKKLRVNALFHMIDNWKGERAYMKVDGVEVWSRKGLTNQKGMDLCGGDSKDAAFGIPINVAIKHSGENVKVEFGTDLNRNSCEASFGIDDVMIYVK